MSRQALQGIKVADFTWVAAGPYFTKSLADHGAEVIKIETSRRPGTLRRLPPYKGSADINRSGYFAMVNSNKYGVSLNLSDPRGVELAKRLVARSDLVAENFMPGTMERMGLGYEELKRVKPDIIMLSLSMQGQWGPHHQYVGLGHVLQGLSGFAHFFGFPDQPPLGATIPFSDMFSPYTGVAACLTALEYRDKTGKGQYIDLSQFECSLAALADVIMDFTVNEKVQMRRGNRDPYAAPHGVFRCRGDERWCAIAVFSPEEWESLCQVIGNPEWVTDLRFATFAARKDNEDELEELLESRTVDYDAEELMVMLQKVGVPAGVVRTPREAFESDPQFQYRERFWILPHLEMEEHISHSPSFKLSKTPAQISRGAPVIGENNEYIFKDILGLSEEEYVQLLLDRVLE